MRVQITNTYRLELVYISVMNFMAYDMVINPMNLGLISQPTKANKGEQSLQTPNSTHKLEYSC